MKQVMTHPGMTQRVHVLKISLYFQMFVLIAQVEKLTQQAIQFQAQTHHVIGLLLQAHRVLYSKELLVLLMIHLALVVPLA